MIATRQRKAALFGALALLAALLFLLTATLERVEFSPGVAAPFPFLAERTQQRGQPTGGLDLGPQVAHRIGLLVLAASTVILFVGALFSRYARRRLLSLCLLSLILLVVWWLWVSRLVPTLEGPTGAPAESEVPLDAIGPPGAGPLQNLPSRTPSLLVTLAALGAALGVAALVAVFLALILPRLRRRASAGLLSDLAERAGVAARRIRGGEDPREVVLACYSEMSTLLAKAHRVPGVAFLTAREFAALLREAGMGEGHVDRLTAIFEDVRYGWRAGERLAEEAVSCLEAIRTGHALEGT